MESNSPWNTPMFVIKKKSGKWRLLQDLRAINTIIKDIKPLQPGLPSPMAVPQGWNIIIIDLQDCFFTIRLNPADYEHFAFNVPSINFKQPFRRYQWITLPQGIKNSPTLCQKFMDQALKNIRRKFKSTYIVHYMDDILLAHNNKETLKILLTDTIQELTLHGLIIAPKKIQKNRPLSYLGHNIHDEYISSQKLTIQKDKLKTLNDFQKLLGDINWIRPYLKITTGTLSPLFSILHGDPNPESSLYMTPEALQAISLMDKALAKARIKQINYSLPWSLLIFTTSYTPTAYLWQQGMLE